MTAIIEVDSAVLVRARTSWDFASDELDGAWRRLGMASVTGFSAAVSAAIEGFRGPWIEEIKTLAQQADGYSSDIVTVGAMLVVADTAAAEQVRSLLPYACRNATVDAW